MHFTASSSEDGPRLTPRWKLGAFRLLADARCADERGGGDFYAFELRDDQRLSLFIGDVCGHGREGAKFLPSVLSRFDELSRATTRPSKLLEELNRRVAAEMPSDRFVTGAAFELDARTGVLVVANAGHVPAVLRSASGKVNVIGRASGPPLGMLPDARYEDQRYAITDGDVLVFMTDGILEAVESDLARMTRLTALVAQAPAGIGPVHRSVLGGVGELALARAADDMTLLSLQIRTQSDPTKPTLF